MSGWLSQASMLKGGSKAPWCTAYIPPQLPRGSCLQSSNHASLHSRRLSTGLDYNPQLPARSRLLSYFVSGGSKHWNFWHKHGLISDRQRLGRHHRPLHTCQFCFRHDWAKRRSGGCEVLRHQTHAQPPSSHRLHIPMRSTEQVSTMTCVTVCKHNPILDCFGYLPLYLYHRELTAVPFVLHGPAGE